MLRSWRFKLREAEEAFKNGRPDLAAMLIREEGLQKYLPGQRLAARVGSRLADRSLKNALAGETEAGWKDLESARSLGAEAEALLAAREELVKRGVEDVEYYFAADNLTQTRRAIEDLERRRITNDRLPVFKDGLRILGQVDELCQSGKFVDADEQLRSLATRLPEIEMIATRRRSCQQKRNRFRQLTAKMHEAMTNDDWEATEELADEMLDMAPDYRLAKDALRRARNELNRQRVDLKRSEPDEWSPNTNAEGAASATCTADLIAEPRQKSLERFLMWVDGVGGYMMCLADEVVLGQAVPDNHVDIPIQGDLSRRHARFRRQGESYVIEPLAPVQIDEQEIDEATVLADGNVIEIGQVRLKYRKPHALSASARLDFISRHRTHPWSDAVVLMAESCVLGRSPQNHIVCRNWDDDVVLFRQDGELCCRAMESLEIDGRICDGHGRIAVNSRVTGQDFAISLEEI